ncbi:hypothetical protein P12x_003874 [Tundrisphaera lichenicola]|uniref:hypothetical protein n=1 Tax=Tundrisphaera lichenicola TaxID=2029860 RepID=UPI003EBB6F78
MNMMTRTLTVGLVASLVGAFAVADDAPQSIKTGALTFKAPAAWKKEQPKSAMRAAQIKIEPVKGDEEPAELVVFAFPNGAGSVESNIERWEKQFVDASKRTPKAKVEQKKGMNVDVTRVEISGQYLSGMPGAASKAEKPNYRLLGAIITTPSTGYFFKLTGPDKTVGDATKGFDSLIESMKLDK